MRFAVVAAMMVLASAHSQQPRAETSSGAAGQILELDYWTGYLRVPYKLLTSPFDWSLGDWGKAALLGAGAGALMFLDSDIKDFVQDDVRNGATDDLADIVRPLGDGLVVASMATGGYVIGAVMGSRRLAAASLTGLQSFTVAATLTEGIKFLSGRQRPNKTDDAFDFGGPFDTDSRNSFVSGHATHAFALATAFAMEYRDSFFIPTLAYSAATLTALSRVNDNRHWASDVALGAGVGFVVGVLSHKMSPFGRGDTSVSFLPYSKGDARGVLISKRF